MTILWLLIALVVVAMGYVRLAPSDPVKWHVSPKVEADKDMQFGVKRLVVAGTDGLERFDGIARATPRTEVLAGSVADGMITYVTRTKVMGFPDYTTVRQEGDTLKIFARQRFGRSDLGVNKTRVDGWIAAFQAR